jgi:N-acetylglucosamine kinase-like BadF-type ATPase
MQHAQIVALTTVKIGPAMSLPGPTLPPTAAPPWRGLGLDAGGTHTRWALADCFGQVCAEGSAAPISGLQLGSEAGRAEVQVTLRAIAQCTGPVQAVVAGITAYDAAQAPVLGALLGSAFAVVPSAVQAHSDIELLCRSACAPGEGIVIYAGTGSVAAAIDSAGRLQRAGGRGAVIDDAGGGHWIARQALRQIWRAEDEAPGGGSTSPLAAAVFAHIGGSDWPTTRAWVYGATRGELGTLALAVAAAAAQDQAALSILQQAGAELARLGAALVRRLGPQALTLAGRVFDLHPAVENAVRAALPPGCPVQRLSTPPHHAAARLAAHATTRKPA